MAALDALLDALGWFFYLGPLVVAILVMVGGFLRLRGRRMPAVDRAAAVSASALAMGVFPPSLRGGGSRVPVPPSRATGHRRQMRGRAPAQLTAGKRPFVG